MSDDKTERINRIKELAQEMVLYSNPAEIEKTAKLIKKNVSLFSRANFCAYLFLKLNSNGGTGKVAEKKGAPKQQTFGMHINIGRNGANYNELSSFICKNASLESSELSHIVMKDNYSFVYFNKDKVSSVMEKLNGLSYGKKKIKANVIR